VDPRVRAQQLSRVAAALVLGLVAGAPAARAEPYLMVRSGAKCSDCHTNQTGGGKRTPFAQIHARDILHDLDLLPIPRGVKAFTGEVNQWISIGADLRVRNRTVFQDHIRNGRVDNNTAFRERVLSNDTDVNEFNGYLQVDLWPDVATFYVDESLNGGATNREVFGLVRGFLPWDTYVKAGRMFPAFGLRVFDDEAFIRARSGFTFQNPDEGAEIGLAPGPFFFATTVTNGQDGDKDVQATVNGYAVIQDVPVLKHLVGGASFARQSDKRNVAAVYGGSNLWRFTYLGEVDFIHDHQPSTVGRRDQLAAYAEVNLLLLDWLNLRGTFDFVKVSHDQDQTRYAIGAEPFINRVIQPRIQYRINNGVESRPEENTDELVFELHMFF
jgi:hypothetical protein